MAEKQCVLFLNNFWYLEIKCVIRTPLDPAEQEDDGLSLTTGKMLLWSRVRSRLLEYHSSSHGGVGRIYKRRPVF